MSPLARLALPLWPALLAAAACHAPATRIDNPGQHTCYLDGVRERRDEVPFRFYGTSRVDVVPADRVEPVPGPDWEHQPASVTVPNPPPASLWLFPLDFGIEVAARLFGAPAGPRVAVAPPATPAELRTDPGVRPAGLEALGERARAARVSR